MDGYLGYVRDALKEYLALPQSPLDSFGETEAKDIAAKQRAYMCDAVHCLPSASLLVHTRSSYLQSVLAVPNLRAVEYRNS